MVKVGCYIEVIFQEALSAYHMLSSDGFEPTTTEVKIN